MKYLRQSTFLRTLAVVVFALGGSACQDFIKVDPPRTELITSTVFTDDATATAAVVGIYSQLAQGFACGDNNSVSYYAALSSDELVNYYTSGSSTDVADVQQISDNTISAASPKILRLWTDIYLAIYKSNAVLEGLESSTINPALRNQLHGEALFIRSFCFWILVNLFGDVPLVVTTDYVVNSSIPRSPTAQVYGQIVTDLVNAKQLLPVNYPAANSERVRANKGAASALLSRVYLYQKDWQGAQRESTELISNTSQYALSTDLSTVFRANGSESILQLWRNTAPGDRIPFVQTGAVPTYGRLRHEFVQGMENGDKRRSSWVGTSGSGAGQFYYSRKYADSSNPPLNYSVVLRLAEQYLIRAEARAELSDFSGAGSDLNQVRSRAGLAPTSATDKASLLQSIERERRYEYFTEWGHRWFDLKRTGRATEVLSAIKPAWKATAALYPIPLQQLLNDPAMSNAQNPGY